MSTDLKKLFRNCDTISRHVSHIDEINNLEIGNFLTPSPFFCEKYKATKLRIINVKEKKYKKVLFFPILSKSILFPESRALEYFCYDKNLRPIYSTCFYRNLYNGFKDHPLLPTYPFANINKTKRIKGKCFYVGILFSHFGHFILESLSRLWREGNLSQYDYFIIHKEAEYSNHELYSSFSSTFWGQYFEALGITRKKIVFVDQPLFVENIHIADSACIIPPRDCFMSPKIKEISLKVNRLMLQNFKDDTKFNFDKIYISRSKAKKPMANRVLQNELELENYLKSNGFFILKPEGLRSEYQKHFILSHAKLIISIPGSGSLNSVFAPKGVTVVSLESSRPANMALLHQLQIDYVCKHNSFVYFSNCNNPENNIWSIDINDMDLKLKSILKNF